MFSIGEAQRWREGEQMQNAASLNSTHTGIVTRGYRKKTTMRSQKLTQHKQQDDKRGIKCERKERNQGMKEKDRNKKKPKYTKQTEMICLFAPDDILHAQFLLFPTLNG